MGIQSIKLDIDLKPVLAAIDDCRVDLSPVLSAVASIDPSAALAEIQELCGLPLDLSPILAEIHKYRSELTSREPVLLQVKRSDVPPAVLLEGDRLQGGSAAGFSPVLSEPRQLKSSLEQLRSKHSNVLLAIEESKKHIELGRQIET